MIIWINPKRKPLGRSVLHDKFPKEVKDRRIILQHNKAWIQQTYIQIILNKQNVFSLKPEVIKGCLCSSILFNKMSKFLSWATKQDKVLKKGGGIQEEMEVI